MPLKTNSKSLWQSPIWSVYWNGNCIIVWALFVNKNCSLLLWRSRKNKCRGEKILSLCFMHFRTFCVTSFSLTISLNGNYTTQAHKLTFMNSKADFYFSLEWKIGKPIESLFHGLLIFLWKDTNRFPRADVWNSSLSSHGLCISFA